MCETQPDDTKSITLSSSFLQYASQLTDVHCHLQEDESLELADSQVGIYAVMGTHPDDWSKVAQLKEKYPDRILAGYGVHPWFAEKASELDSKRQEHLCIEKLDEKLDSNEEENLSWLKSLRNNLEKDSQSIVGEIGLDKIALDPTTKKRYDLEKQKAVCSLQLQLAQQLNKPASVHCVRAWGSLLEILETIRSDLLRPSDHPYRLGLGFPPKLMFHSFLGSLDTLKRINATFTFTPTQHKHISATTDLPFHPPQAYYSFSQLVNGRAVTKTQEILRAIPRDRILLESDMGSAQVADHQLNTVAALVADALGLDLDTVYQFTTSNANQFFRNS